MFGAKLNRQPGPLNTDALQMLRDKGVKKFSKVVTADNEVIGDALRLRLRQEEVNVELKNYAAYIDVASLKLGTHFYIPTEFVKDYDPENGLISLSVSFAVVQDESWNREPSFIAGHLDRVEDLAD